MVVVVMWNCNFCEWVPLTIAVELIPGLWNTHRSHNQVHAVTYHHLSSSIPGASLQLYCIFGYCELGEWTTFPSSRAAWSILRSKLREMLSMNISTALYALNVWATINRIKSFCSEAKFSYCIIYYTWKAFSS